MTVKHIAIIGGGPAGFTAAITAAENASSSISIVIYEKNIPLKTILYTGNGRCNLSNDINDFKELASNYPRGEKFLYSVFRRFGVGETIEMFKKYGIKTYVQPDGRIFPVSDKASEVRTMFLEKAEKHAIRIQSETSVKKITKKCDKFIVYAENFTEEFDTVIIAAGGNSKNIAGSGYELAKSFGHTIKELKPSLTGLRIKENSEGKLAGVSVKNAEITSVFDGKAVKKFKAGFIFTHKGVTGPAIFKTSAYCCYKDYSRENPLILKINFVPEKEKNELDKELIKEFNNNPHKEVENLLKKYAPKALITELLKQLSVDGDKKAGQIIKEERKKILSMLTETTLSVVSPEPEGEIVTAGGVSLNEINPKTLESKLVPGLYFCGEVMDIDGLTGGFNLQACWSAGFIAGMSVVN